MCNKNFISPGPIGKNEKQILDNIETLNNIKIHRGFRIVDVYVDGYDSINNVVYEVDEKYHKYQITKDFIREHKIKEKIDCKIVRIKDGW